MLIRRVTVASTTCKTDSEQAALIATARQAHRSCLRWICRLRRLRPRPDNQRVQDHRTEPRRRLGGVGFRSTARFRAQSHVRRCERDRNSDDPVRPSRPSRYHRLRWHQRSLDGSERPTQDPAGIATASPDCGSRYAKITRCREVSDYQPPRQLSDGKTISLMAALKGAKAVFSFGVASRVAHSSNAPRTKKVSRSSCFPRLRTLVPLWGTFSTNRRLASSRSASRTGAWLVPISRAILSSTNRSPLRYTPSRIRLIRSALI